MPTVISFILSLLISVRSSAIDPGLSSPFLHVNEPDFLLNVNEERNTSPFCPFIRPSYKCSERIVEDNWSSCCSRGSCTEQCNDGKLKENTRLLFIGNSYIREITQAIVCQNLDTLTSILFTPDAKITNKMLMSGSASPSLVKWTYSTDSGLLDEFGNKQFVAPSDGPTLYIFSNNSKIFTAINTPLILIPFLNFEQYFGLEVVMKYLDFSFSELTGIVASGGNSRVWGYNQWCLKSDMHLWNQPPLNDTVCQKLSQYNSPKITLVDLVKLLDQISALNFHGKMIITGLSMVGFPLPSPVPNEYVSLLNYEVEYVDYASFLKGNLCMVPKCKMKAGHMCLPGPPDDGAKIFLNKIYA